MGENTTAWGNPTIPGTRIPIARIQELAEAFTPKAIAERVYDGRITEEQVKQAILSVQEPEGER